jgi:outer membrane protein assembly factor BamB
VPDDGTEDDYFGWAVGISDGLVLVGARLDDDLGSRSGSAYVFDASTGQQILKLLASDGAESDNFGFAAAIDGGLALVGSPGADGGSTDSGAVYVFNASTGEQLMKLVATDGTAGDIFGRAVAISNNIAVIGAPGDTDNGDFSGSAYLFDLKTGVQIAKLLPHDGVVSDLFGKAVAIDGATVLVGANGHRHDGTRSGAAYVFDAATGHEIAELLPTDPARDAQFGISVAIGGSQVFIGAVRDDDQALDAGAVYIFDTDTGEQLQKLTVADGEEDDLFGSAVAVSGDRAVFTSPEDDDNGFRAGSAYVFVRCAIDLTRDGFVDTRDVIAFLRLWAARDAEADWDGDGDVDPQDVLAFLDDWLAGCP